MEHLKELLNNQLTAAKSDLESATKEREELETRYKTEKAASKLKISVLESVISDIEKRLVKLA